MKTILVFLLSFSLYSCKKCTECVLYNYSDASKPQGNISLFEFCGTSKEIKSLEKSSNSLQEIKCK
jgi:hypothetical protein